jgi:uncharacterized protein (DUF2141 family)
MNKQRIKNKKFYILTVLAISLITIPALTTDSPVSAAVTSSTCDSSGTAKTVFNPGWSTDGSTWHGGESVYFKASGLSPSTTYPIYVFIKNDGWGSGSSFSSVTRFFHTATSITTDSAGNVAPTSIYSRMAAGEYTAAVDVNKNGIYDSGDILINIDVTLAIVATDGYDVLKTVYLTMPEIYAMSSYTGVGCPRRSGGYYPADQIGKYTGVPMPFICNLVGGMKTSSLCTYATAVDGYCTSQSYSQVYENVWPQYNISEGLAHPYGGDSVAKISGQLPITLLAYKVNGTRLPSDGTGLDSDLGGPLRDVVVANNGTSSILANDGMATFGTTFCKYLTSIVIMNPGTLAFQTCDSGGTEKTSFNSGNAVYFSAAGLGQSKTYPVYMVNDASAWAVRIPMPTRVSGSTATVSTDSSGNVAATSVYTNAQAGNYAVIVDVDSDGQYDEADLLLSGIKVTGQSSPTTSVSPSPTTSNPSSQPSPTVPEFPVIGMVAGLLLVVTVTGLIVLRKKRYLRSAGSWFVG